MERKSIDTAALIELALEEGDASLQEGIQFEVDALEKELEKLELELAFSGEYDSRNAMLSIHAGAGGTESMDWADMLMRM